MRSEKRRSVRRNSRRTNRRRNRNTSRRTNRRRRSVRRNTRRRTNRRRRSVRRNSRRRSVRRNIIQRGGMDVMDAMVLPNMICVTWNVGGNTVEKLQALSAKLQPVVDQKKPELIVISLQECGDRLGSGCFGFTGYTEVEITGKWMRNMYMPKMKGTDFRLAIAIFKRENYTPHITTNSNMHHIGLSEKKFFKGFLTVDVIIGDLKFPINLSNCFIIKFVSLHFPFMDHGESELTSCLKQMFSECSDSQYHVIYMGDFNSRMLLTTECAIKDSKSAHCRPAGEMVEGVIKVKNPIFQDDEYCTLFEHVKTSIHERSGNLLELTGTCYDGQPIIDNGECDESLDLEGKVSKFSEDEFPTFMTKTDDEINYFLRQHDYFGHSFYASIQEMGSTATSYCQPTKVGPIITYKFDKDTGQLVSFDTKKDAGRLMGEPDKFVCYSHGEWPYRMVACNVKMDPTVMNDHLPVMAYMELGAEAVSPRTVVGTPLTEVGTPRTVVGSPTKAEAKAKKAEAKAKAKKAKAKAEAKAKKAKGSKKARAMVTTEPEPVATVDNRWKVSATPSEFFDIITARIKVLEGLTTEGIFRIPGNNDVTTEIKRQLEVGSNPTTVLNQSAITIGGELKPVDIHDIATCFTRWLREEPYMIPRGKYREIHELTEENCNAFVEKLDDPGKTMLIKLISFLQKIDKDATKMKPGNLAIVFSPTVVFRGDPMEMMGNITEDTTFVKLLIEELTNDE